MLLYFSLHGFIIIFDEHRIIDRKYLIFIKYIDKMNKGLPEIHPSDQDVVSNRNVELISPTANHRFKTVLVM